MPTLRELREAAGMTQDELAKRVGVATNTVYRWESGSGDNRFQPRGPAKRLLGIIFGVDAETITYGGEGSDKQP